MVLRHETDGCRRSELIEMDSLSSLILEHSAKSIFLILICFSVICYDVEYFAYCKNGTIRLRLVY